MGNSGSNSNESSGVASNVQSPEEDESLMRGGNSPKNMDQAKQLLAQKVGYRVLGVQASSPASFCGLVAFFDFIVAANNVPLKALDTTLLGIIKASEEKPLSLMVFNSKNHSLREVVLVPSRRWPGEGLLGAIIRFDTFEDADEHVLHVLDVETNSPAEIAGLEPEHDFILGTAERAFRDTDDFIHELQRHLDRPAEFYVYHSLRDEVRIVVIMPTEDWGGEGILGAGVGQGYLHRLPQAACNTLGRSREVAASASVNSPFGHNAAHSSSFTGPPVPSSSSSAVSAPPLPFTLHNNASTMSAAAPAAAPVSAPLPPQVAAAPSTQSLPQPPLPHHIQPQPPLQLEPQLGSGVGVAQAAT